MTDSTDVLVSERLGAILTLRLNRPEARNALNPALMIALGSAMIAAEADPGVRAIVLTGTGSKAFCAGMDLASFAAGEDMMPADAAAEIDAFRRLLNGEVTVPMVGAANATAVAGGFELLLGCDVVVASSEARFGLPEVKRGLFAAGGGTSIGTRIPLAIALELSLTGDLIDAARAVEIGLINRSVEPDEVMTAATALAERIAANGPLGLAATKELVRLCVSDSAAAAQRLGEWQAIVFASEDAKEGAQAFVEKRSPVWQGR